MKHPVSTITISISVLASIAACGAAPGTRPHDMSVARHEAGARTEDESADVHAAEYDATASAPLRCGASAASVALGSPCWTADVNPTEVHRADARRHREAAAAHRAAAGALRTAEAADCVGISEADRDQSPFSHREDIVSVAELTEDAATDRRIAGRAVGARIVVRAVPGLAAETLERILACHIARNAALGPDVPELADCPLVPAGVTVEAHPSDEGLVVDVRAADGASAAEVVSRARALGP